MEIVSGIHRIKCKFGSKANFTLKEAIQILAPNLGTWPPETNNYLAFGMAGNLHRLVQRGQLTTGRDQNGPITWSLS